MKRLESSRLQEAEKKAQDLKKNFKHQGFEKEKIGRLILTVRRTRQFSVLHKPLLKQKPDQPETNEAHTPLVSFKFAVTLFCRPYMPLFLGPS